MYWPKQGKKYSLTRDVPPGANLTQICDSSRFRRKCKHVRQIHRSKRYRTMTGLSVLRWRQHTTTSPALPCGCMYIGKSTVQPQKVKRYAGLIAAAFAEELLGLFVHASPQEHAERGQKTLDYNTISLQHFLYFNSMHRMGEIQLAANETRSGVTKPFRTVDSPQRNNGRLCPGGRPCTSYATTWLMNNASKARC